MSHSKTKPREGGQPPCTLIVSILPFYAFPTSRAVDELPELQKKSPPPTDSLSISQEGAVEEVTPGNVNLCLPPERTVYLVLTLGK